jgi:hypothetical protein
MRRKWMVALVIAAVTLFAGALQEALAAEKTMKIRVPGCV